MKIALWGVVLTYLWVVFNGLLLGGPMGTNNLLDKYKDFITVNDKKAQMVLENFLEKYAPFLGEAESDTKYVTGIIKIKLYSNFNAAADFSFHYGKGRITVNGDFGNYRIFVDGRKAIFFAEDDKLYTTYEGKDAVEDEENTSATAPESKAVFSYVGTVTTKAGKMHKIKMADSRLLVDDGVAYLYFLDRQWDPYKMEFNAVDGKGTITLTDLSFNDPLSDDMYTYSTEGYEEISPAKMMDLITERLNYRPNKESGGE